MRLLMAASCSISPTKKSVAPIQATGPSRGIDPERFVCSHGAMTTTPSMIGPLRAAKIRWLVSS